MHRASLAVITTLLIAAPAIHAQTTVPLNSRVRVEFGDGERVIGTLTGDRGDTLIVIRDGLLWDSKYRIPARRITRVDVSRGKHVSRGRVVGSAVLGAVGGMLMVYVIPELSSQCSDDVCAGPRAMEAMVVGAASGVIIGSLIPVDRWEAVPRPVRVGLGGDARHARLGISLAF